ncbi:MltR family transcriptional regulator [Sulfuriflexus mobilis]|uniref:MltR family transcriptional regulator n=1 Tax=Sulfuriflexus mobilis TaxID=1811807 RepID=UPI000F84D908|nr:MltR family transcriptional regulator [Sulfuriflexus mobilis]
MRKQLEPELEEIERFFSQFSKETDRGAALTAGAMLEDRLGDIIKGFLIDSKESEKLLKGTNAPFGTLSSRISACFALGLIDRIEFEEMETIRKIRNKFAHNWDKVSFQTDSIKDLTNSLPWRGPAEFEKNTTIKDRFCTAMSMLMVDLVWRTRLVKKERRELKEWPDKLR